MSSEWLTASTMSGLNPEEMERYNQEITRQNIRRILLVAKSVVKDIKSNYKGNS